MVRVLYWLALLLIVALALALRLPNLAQRPMHNDEGVNAVKFNDLRKGDFKYDPNEYHGPTLYYFTLPVAWVTGAKDFASTDEVTLRGVTVIFGVGLILLLPLVSDGLGRGGVLWAGLFTAVSPAFVFYSRYYIHEMPLVFFAFGAIACGWRYRRTNHLTWAAACGVFVGLTYATKETWVLALAAAAGSAVTAATIWRLLIKGIPHHLHFRKRAVAVGLVAFVVVFVVFFSGFFTRMQGVADAVMAYVHYSGRASGSIHDHSWNYYLSMLLWWPIKGVAESAGWWKKGWTEGAIVGLAVVGFLLAVLRRHGVHHAGKHPQTVEGEGEKEEKTSGAEATKPMVMFPTFPPFVRFLGFYTLFLVVGFSIIPYKTPWCMLGFLHGMILLAGFACGQIIHLLPGVVGKTLGALVLLAAAGHLAWEADRATNNFADAKHPHAFEADTKNPYVYAQTDRDIFELIARVEAVAAVTGKPKQIYIQVVTADCWPLPFYLRRFEKVGYWQTPMENLTGDILIGGSDLAEQLSAEGGKRQYVGGWYRLRPKVRIWVYVEKSLYERWQALRR